MHDALLIYFMITNMRHAGYFRFAVRPFQRARAQYTSVWFAVERSWKATMATVGQNVSGGRGGGTRRASALAKFYSGDTISLAAQSDWLQALTRLENYVVSMR
jgi:hypothetical protein